MLQVQPCTCQPIICLISFSQTRNQITPVLNQKKTIFFTCGTMVVIPDDPGYEGSLGYINIADCEQSVDSETRYLCMSLCQCVSQSVYAGVVACTGGVTSLQLLLHTTQEDSTNLSSYNSGENICDLTQIIALVRIQPLTCFEKS